jgi:hypothetical protein
MNSISVSANFNAPPDQNPNFAMHSNTPNTVNLSHLEQQAVEQQTDLDNARALI